MIVEYSFQKNRIVRVISHYFVFFESDVTPTPNVVDETDTVIAITQYENESQLSEVILAFRPVRSQKNKKYCMSGRQSVSGRQGWQG